MAFEQEVSYCVDCCEVYYPTKREVCPCNGKYRVVIKVPLNLACKIAQLREEGKVHVTIGEGQLISSNGPVRPGGEGAAGNGNDTEGVRRGEAVPDPGGQANEGTDGKVEAGCGRDGDPGDVEGTAKVGGGNGQGDRGGEA